MSDWSEDLFVHAPCGYVEVDGEGVIIRANDAFLALVGLASDEVVDTKTFAGLLAVGDRIHHETHFRPSLQMHGAVHEIAYELVRPDGTKTPVLVSANLSDGDEPTTRTIVFEARDRRRYETELLLARRAAEAAEQRSRELAQTLQGTFVPPTPPHIPHLSVAAAYRPAGDGSEVGGDFYDIFQLRTDEWVVALGDVSGKGVEAAAVTASVRHWIRALMVQHDSPADVLEALNELLIAHASDRFCTVVLLRLLRDGDQWLATVCSGGHPLPVLIDEAGQATELGVPGSLIGVLGSPQLTDVRRTLVPGDRVVMFTDGVTEARSGIEVFGDGGLVAALGPGTADETTTRILETVLGFQDGVARDDIAIVTVEVADVAVEPQAAFSRLDFDEVNRALRALRDEA